MLHAIAHIELNAVNLALDVAARFWAKAMPDDFYRQWIGVADDEAKHFLLLNDRLAALDGAYGDLPAHNGLWESAIATKDDRWRGWPWCRWCWKPAGWMSLR